MADYPSFDATTGPQLARAAGRGDIRVLGRMLKDISDRIDTLAEAEIAVLDGVTAGTGLASKALVLDSSGNVAMPATGMFGMSRAALAATGADDTDAAVIATQVVAVTGSDGAKGVALPAAATTEGPILVINTVLTSGANLKVWPVTGGNDLINGEAEDAHFLMGPGEAAWFIPTSATQWYVADHAGNLLTKTEINLLDGLTAAAAELNYNDIAVLGTGAASKAVVLDTGEDYTWPSTGILTYGVLKDSAATTLTSTAAELNLLDGSSVTNATASVAPILDSTKRMVTTATAGAVGTGVTAVEFSADGINFTTILTLTGIAITIGDTAALSMGALIYTLPAGDVAIKASAISVGLTLTTGTPTTDTPEVGLGTVVGSGANATLGGVGATSGDIMEGVVMADIAGAAKANMDQRPMGMLAGADHTVYLNFADTWANVDDTAATAAGTVTLSWSKLPLA